MSEEMELEGEWVMGWPDRKRARVMPSKDSEGRTIFARSPVLDLEGVLTPTDASVGVSTPSRSRTGERANIVRPSESLLGITRARLRSGQPITHSPSSSISSDILSLLLSGISVLIILRSFLRFRGLRAP